MSKLLNPSQSFSSLIKVAKANHGAKVIKTRTGAIAEAGPAGRKYQVKGQDAEKAILLFQVAGFKVDSAGSTSIVTRLTI